MTSPNATSEISKILGWENNIVDYVLDPIYGPIGLTVLELDLINDEVFTRLKNIKQLGFVSYIYPSATHTRFEHSIGTLAITWEMLKRLLKKFEENNEKAITKLFTDDVIQSVRLAALMHDLGHGPFSHSLEIALRYLDIKFDHDDLTSYLLTFELGNAYECKSIKSSCNALDPLKNEKLQTFRESIKRLLKPELRMLILSIFNRDFYSPSVSSDFEKIHNFLHDVIKGDIGSDRIDYLLRDTYFTGLGHKFSLSELLDNLYYVFDEINNQIVLAIVPDGKAALELMLLTRYFHYQFIAHDPRNVMMTALLQNRIAKYLQGKKAESAEEKQRQILDIALNSDWIEKDLPQPDLFCLVHKVMLLDFRDFTSRFLFFRIVEDHKLRSIFQKAIEKHILEKHSLNLMGKILFNFTVEDPRIPILHLYKDKYLIGALKNSVLVHDNSPFLVGLGRAYLENSYMTIYVTSDVETDARKAFSNDPDFYKHRQFLKEIIREIAPIPDALKIHDHLLFMIDKLSMNAKDMTIQHFSRISEEYKAFMKKKEPEYEYARYEKFYDHESKEDFEFPDWLFNALIIFDVCKFLDVELSTSPYKIVDSKTIYKPTYSFRVRSYPLERKPEEERYIPPYFIPLRGTVKTYPKAIQRYYSDQENRP